MAAKFLLVSLATVLFASAYGEQGIPLLMWKSTGALPSMPDVSRSRAPTVEDFKLKVLESLDKIDNILLFAQDTLGVEDFSKYGKAAYAYVSSAFNGDDSSHLFLPRVVEAVDASLETLGRTRKVTEINEAADGLRVANILKSSPRNLIVIRLRTAGSGRLDALIEKDEAIKKFVEAIGGKTDNFVAILTGEKPNPIDLKRPKREIGAAKNIHLNGVCIDIAAKALKIERGSSSEVAGEKRKTIEVPDQEVNPNDGEMCAADRSVSFNIDTHDPQITSLKLTFDFEKNDKGWEMSRLMADYQLDKETAKTEELTTTQNIAQKIPKTYVAHNPVKFTSKDKQFSLVFDGLSVNPYPADAPAKTKVRASEPAQGNVYFSIPILSALTVSILFIIIMTWALDNITSIKTMDQFDDPRGKTITVPVSD